MQCNMTTSNCAISIITWPVVAMWRLAGFVVVVMLRLFAAMLGLGFMTAGIGLTMTMIAAPVGIPFAILGFLLILRSVF